MLYNIFTVYFFPYTQGPYLCSYPMFLVYYTILLVLFIFPFHHPSLIAPTPPALQKIANRLAVPAVLLPEEEKNSLILEKPT